MRKPRFPKTLDILYRQAEEENPPQNIVDTLAKLVRFNKKYEVIMVPSSVTLKQNFLMKECFAIAPHADAVAVNPVAFLYKGLFYIYPKKNVSDNIFTNNPYLIMSLVKQTIDELKGKNPQLREYREEIIAYFEEHTEIDQVRILQMNTKELSIQLAEYCGDKKVIESANLFIETLKSKIGLKKDESAKNANLEKSKGFDLDKSMC